MATFCPKPNGTPPGGVYISTRSILNIAPPTWEFFLAVFCAKGGTLKNAKNGTFFSVSNCIAINCGGFQFPRFIYKEKTWKQALQTRMLFRFVLCHHVIY